MQWKEENLNAFILKANLLVFHQTVNCNLQNHVCCNLFLLGWLYKKCFLCFMLIEVGVYQQPG